MKADPLGYPFAAPHESYELGDGARGEIAVLAYGANGSPEVLRRKLGDDAHLSAHAGTLHDFDAVYSAHISPYGAIPATLRRSPGSAVPVWTLLLDDAQFARLAATEPNYDAVPLAGALAFISKHVALAVGVEPVRLEDRTQREVQELARDRLAPGETVEEFIERNVADPERAAGFTAALRREGIPFV